MIFTSGAQTTGVIPDAHLELGARPPFRFSRIFVVLWGNSSLNTAASGFANMRCCQSAEALHHQASLLCRSTVKPLSPSTFSRLKRTPWDSASYYHFVFYGTLSSGVCGVVMSMESKTVEEFLGIPENVIPCSPDCYTTYYTLNSVYHPFPATALSIANWAGQSGRYFTNEEDRNPFDRPA